MQNGKQEKNAQVVYAVGNSSFADVDGSLRSLWQGATMTRDEITRLAEEAFFVKKQKSPAQLFATEP